MHLKNKLIILAVLAFLALHFFRIPYGADSYDFLSHICNGTPLHSEPSPPILKIINFLPCNFFYVNIIIFLVKLSIFLIVLHFFGLEIALLCLVAPVFWMDLIKFEDDLFVLPLCFFSQALFIVFLKENNKSAAFFSFLTALLALALWKGAFYLIAGLIFGINYYLGLFFSLTFLKYVVPVFPAFDTAAIEQLPIVALRFLLFAVVGVLAMPKWLKRYGIATLALSLLNARFSLFAVLPLAFGLKQLLRRRKVRDFVVGIVAGAVAINMLLLFCSAPTPKDFELMHKTIQLAGELGIPFSNDWSSGYWVEFATGKDINNNGANWKNILPSDRRFLLISYAPQKCNEIGRSRHLVAYYCGSS